ncbi:hypothetical protein Q0Z83_054010 [Actinoplanes sichuanensis]|uniref:Polymerase nucleotidyl transferase domain-containing protein n=1 Tax=Actinoplanes sichuanensis TaxID=512349 RepID=A0ABW4ARY7_9ACTN|nr:hypothetical protein [Actinoplanes sichuanensis]BEL07210.1 hypothetical protein Q0Z83_054010 [Actinoplanes sichuanensis]
MNSELVDVVAALTDGAFGAYLDFACLTGSAVDRADPDADVDVIAVLKVATPPDEAVRMRLDFSAEYGRLHYRLGRRPDLEWPGEVAFASDVVSARTGAAFQRGRPSGIEPAPLDTPWRYWISMVASGFPVSGFERHADEAGLCSQAIVRQQLSSKLPLGGSISLSEFLAAESWWKQWRLPTGSSLRGRYVVANVTHALAALSATREVSIRDGVIAVDSRGVRRWEESLRPPVEPPFLDGFQPQYCIAAVRAHDEIIESEGTDEDSHRPS